MEIDGKWSNDFFVRVTNEKLMESYSADYFMIITLENYNNMINSLSGCIEQMSGSNCTAVKDAIKTLSAINKPTGE